MKIIDENEMISILNSSRNVLLLEPDYKNKYLPLGLAKISSFVKGNGGKVNYRKGFYDYGYYDLICITTLFTYNYKEIIETLNSCFYFGKTSCKIVLGGIAATLITNEFERYDNNVLIFRGYSKILDSCLPDYSIDYIMENKYKDFSVVFTTRGCPNNCGYCCVNKMESDLWINSDWKNCIDLSKKMVMVCDNNLSSFGNHFFDVCSYLYEIDKKVVFDNGFDCKYITKEKAEILGKLKYFESGFRTAFDRIEDDGIFQDVIKLLLDCGVKKSHLMAYVLFNFNDIPQEANYRAEECKRLKIRPYPQMYSPFNYSFEKLKDKFIGKYWTKNLCRYFRYFWLMAGYYTKMTFEEYILYVERETGRKLLDKEDWDKWNYRR